MPSPQPTPVPSPLPTPMPSPPPTPMPVGDAPATDNGGDYTCGTRITYVMKGLGYDKARACTAVSSKCENGPCGPDCDPLQSSPPPTFIPSPSPTPMPSPHIMSLMVSTFCGCDSCTQGVWDSPATDGGGDCTCGARITYVMKGLGYDKAGACTAISSKIENGPCGSF